MDVPYYYDLVLEGEEGEKIRAIGFPSVINIARIDYLAKYRCKFVNTGAMSEHG